MLKKHQHHIVTFSLETLSFVIYLNVLPCILLINDSAFKANVAESNWYNAFLNLFNCQYTNEADDDDEEEVVDG